jgi:hypothetical protein
MTMIGAPPPARTPDRVPPIAPVSPWKRWLRLIVGWTFIVLGVVGLVLPILQGVLFLAIGFAILAKDYPWADRQLDKLRRHYPQMTATFDQAAERAGAWLKRLNNRRMGR